MATKEKLLSLLTEHPGSYLSGEELAQQLGVSRAAVWKAVKALKGQGCTIDAVTNKGYCLRDSWDLLSEAGIAEKIDRDFWKIQTASTLPSTNSALRDLANTGAPEGTVLIAEGQSAGRGRMGRSFFSPENTGLYLSILLRPRELSPAQALQITTMAASALCLAIEEVTGKSPGIKWVNDLFWEGKKICGILTEASFSMETGMLDYAVVGLGLNLYPPKEGFPQALSEIAGALLETPTKDTKNRIAAGFLNHFGGFYRNQQFQQAAGIYRAHSLLTGKYVLVGERKALVLDITDRCQLLVEYEDGSRQALSYGEVSIVNQI